MNYLSKIIRRLFIHLERPPPFPPQIVFFIVLSYNKECYFDFPIVSLNKFLIIIFSTDFSPLKIFFELILVFPSDWIGEEESMHRQYLFLRTSFLNSDQTIFWIYVW